MSGLAIVMMLLFIIIIWGGLIYFATKLMKHPDETAGFLGDDPRAVDNVLLTLEDQ